MPLRNPKRGKREHAEGQKRGARKSPKIIRNWGYRWRLWKQKVKSARDARVSRARARNGLISSETRVITPRFSITPFSDSRKRAPDWPKMNMPLLAIFANRAEKNTKSRIFYDYTKLKYIFYRLRLQYFNSINPYIYSGHTVSTAIVRKSHTDMGRKI